MKAEAWALENLKALADCIDQGAPVPEHIAAWFVRAARRCAVYGTRLDELLQLKPADTAAHLKKQRDALLREAFALTEGASDTARRTVLLKTMRRVDMFYKRYQQSGLPPGRSEIQSLVFEARQHYRFSFSDRQLYNIILK